LWLAINYTTSSSTNHIIAWSCNGNVYKALKSWFSNPDLIALYPYSDNGFRIPPLALWNYIEARLEREKGAFIGTTDEMRNMYAFERNRLKENREIVINDRITFDTESLDNKIELANRIVAFMKDYQWAISFKAGIGCHIDYNKEDLDIHLENEEGGKLFWITYPG